MIEKTSRDTEECGFNQVVEKWTFALDQVVEKWTFALDNGRLHCFTTCHSSNNLPASSTATKARLLLKAQEKKNNGEAFLCILLSLPSLTALSLSPYPLSLALASPRSTAFGADPTRPPAPTTGPRRRPPSPANGFLSLPTLSLSRPGPRPRRRRRPSAPTRSDLRPRPPVNGADPRRRPPVPVSPPRWSPPTLLCPYPPPPPPSSGAGTTAEARSSAATSSAPAARSPAAADPSQQRNPSAAGRRGAWLPARSTSETR
ncbi:vegetative cell wall protein gp1-like [Capsicum annuum]|uniref:vegetative cell wall protein gp1-like n=1 Tax=Capsicum annuum TaxID=4072 RepID=UPI001FB17B09|nr:vegetative cell wall protein gp1-like [Capsicum annuum]